MTKTRTLFFIENQKKIIADAPQLKVEVPIHPDVPHMVCVVSQRQENFALKITEKGKLYRLMHF